jgi:hypothetical protein
MFKRFARAITRPLLTITVGALLILEASTCTNAPSHAGVAGSCSINSDCNSPLVYAFGRCHNASNESRDCSPGQRCVPSGAMGVCELPLETCPTCDAGSGDSESDGQANDVNPAQVRCDEFAVGTAGSLSKSTGRRKP